jgi:hypothetical protein
MATFPPFVFFAFRILESGIRRVGAADLPDDLAQTAIQVAWMQQPGVRSFGLRVLPIQAEEVAGFLRLSCA